VKHILPAFLVGLLVMTPVVSQAKKPGPPARRFVGELERLGKTGEDFLILGVDAPGFDRLSLPQKTLSYFLYRAAIAGHHIFTDQAHRFAGEITELLEQIHLHSRGLSAPTRAAVQDYLKYLWINHGHYHAELHKKFVPTRLTPAMLEKAALHALRLGAALGSEDELRAKLRRLQPHIFDASFEPIQTNQAKGEDILATSFVNLYHPGITTAQFEKQVSKEWQERLNVYFDLRDGKIVPEVYRIGGRYDRDLRTIVHFLEQALPYAESDEQKKSLQSLIAYYKSGDEAKFREYSVYWLKSATTVDYLNGFIEQYYDPRGVIGQFEANVSFLSDSALIGKLAAAASYFEKKMPWPAQYKRATVTPPVSNVVNVVVETGDSGPTSPAAYNLPNYDDIRRDAGSKNIILLNIEEAASEKIRDQTIAEFYLPKHQDFFRRFGKVGRQWEVYMHEVIGHGSGQPAAHLKDDPRKLIGRAYSSLEECRADLVALYHILDPKLVEIGAFSAADQSKVAEAQYIGFLQGHVNRYRSLEDDTIREAHRKGRQLVLNYLLNGGEEGGKDYGVSMIERQGHIYVEVGDIPKMHTGVGALLERLQVIKSTGDADGASRLFDRFGTQVNTAWRDDIKSRAARLRMPRETAFVFPQLAPVVRDGRIVDVKVETREDLTAQMLRFSRWRYSTELVPAVPRP